MTAPATCLCGETFTGEAALLRHVGTCGGQKKQPPKRAKYGNVRTTYTSPLWGDRTYASKVEAEYALWLDGQAHRPPLVWWMPQPTVPLAGLTYRPDFMLIWCNPTQFSYQVEFVDVKGVETPRFRDIRKLWVKHAKFPLRIVKRGRVDEVIVSDTAT